MTMWYEDIQETRGKQKANGYLFQLCTICIDQTQVLAESCQKFHEILAKETIKSMRI